MAKTKVHVDFCLSADKINEMKEVVNNHITESGYYRETVKAEQEKLTAGQVELKATLVSLETKIDQLIEVYTAANLLKKFIIGLIGFLGALTALFISWYKIYKAM